MPRIVLIEDRNYDDDMLLEATGLSLMARELVFCWHHQDLSSV